MFDLLREWFDDSTPGAMDQEKAAYGKTTDPNDRQSRRISLKTWWPKYTQGDFRFELCIGMLLVHRVAWPQVKLCIQNLDRSLKAGGASFEARALLEIPVADFEAQINASRFPKQKARRIRRFCQFVVESQSLDFIFRRQDLGRQLSDLKTGFGQESRDTVLLYAANQPVFIADAYARKVLQVLGLLQKDDYDLCQNIFQEAIQIDFDAQSIDRIASEYDTDALRYVLCNSTLKKDISLMLLYQQFHAGIVELGKSKRWEEFRLRLMSGK